MLTQDNKRRQVRTGLPVLVAFLASMAAQAGTFRCQDVDPTAAGHSHVFGYLTEERDISPVEFVYCRHDSSPRWTARWAPFEHVDIDGELWSRYATARCWDRKGDFNCRITEHVVAGDSHVVVDIPSCEIGIPDIAAVNAAVSAEFPGYEMKEIEFTVVLDGGGWSRSEYGYRVTLIAPPKYDSGPIRHFVRRCGDGQCQWHDNGSEGTWFGGSTHLHSLRRMRNDPLIEYLER